MKQHTQRFKEAITELGKQQSVLITYTIDNEEVMLGVEEINSATPRYDADLLKSVMKELHLDSNVDIPVGTEINFKYGLLVDGEFEYLDYGNYIVYTSEKKEDTSSYEILCYDKMLYAMKEYEELNIRYPCTVIQYINAIATKMGLKVSSNNNKFPNYNTEIAGEFYLSIDEETKERTSLGYTYRDILDDLAEVTASVICINEYDELEVRDIKDAINYKTTEKSKELKIESQLEAPIQLVTLDGASTQETRSGKNLIIFDDIEETTVDGITYSIKNGIVTLNGTSTKVVNIYSKPVDISVVGRYVLSKNIEGTYDIGTGTSNSSILTQIKQQDGSYSTKSEIGLGSLGNATSADYSEGTYRLRIYISKGNIFTNFKYKPQLEQGTSDTFFEQGGASPSPEFPSEIQSLGDDVNLFDKNNADIKSFYVHPTLIEKNDINKYIVYPCKPNTYYSISKVESSKFIINGTTNYPEINNTDIKNRVVFSNNIAEGYLTTSDTNYLCIRFKEANDTLTEQEILDTLKVQKGTVATAYSEYGKGTVEIKQSGKNKINLKDIRQATYCTAIETDNSIQITTTSETNNPSVAINCILEPGNYYLHFEKPVSSINLALYDENNNKVSGSSNIYNSGLITITAKTSYMRINTGVADGSYILPFESLYINKGTEDLGYEPYKENSYVIPTQPLRSLPNGVCDTIEEDGIHRRVRSIVLDGVTYKFSGFDSDANNRCFATIGSSLPNNYQIENSYCSHFDYNLNVYRDTDDEIGFVATNTRFYFRFSSSSDIKTIGLANNWLAEQYANGTPVILNFPLAEEVIEPFDEEQQAVLNSMETFEGVNIISSNTELQIRYAIDQDTIDEEYLKDTNVNFGEVFGPVNAVVLSRSSSDNIYRNDVASINQNGLYEIKISDNQIMNQNNRDTFIQAIFDKLKGLTYGICDFSSTGIMYYDLLDRFNVKVGDNTYSIVMFHDEQNITQGLEENIFAEKPERSETDYTKADKTDQKLNQTNLIVDKQNQQISALVSSNTALEQKTAQLIIDVEGIKGQISDVADVTTTAEGYGTAEIDNISGDSEPIYLRVYPTNEDILSLKPSIGLYPRVGLYSHSREIYIKNTSSQEPYQLIYNIPSDLYQLDGVYDEFVLTYEAKECYVIHRIGINENGEKYLLETETIESFDYPNLPLTEGDYQIYTPAFNMAYIYVRLMAKNIYTDQFATKVELKSTVEQTANSITSSVVQKLTNYDTKTEVNSKISQTATEINSEVSKKVGEDEIISKINQSAEQVQINANKFSLARKNSKSNWR